MRKPVIAANWKMHKTRAQAQEFCEALVPYLPQNDDVETVIFAPFTTFSVMQKELLHTKVGLGAQNFYPAQEGAYTGEISAYMLKEFGVKYVLIGHSERRMLFKEDDRLLNEKVLAAYEADLQPIFCCGEPLEVRENGQAREYCLRQLSMAVSNLTMEQAAGLIIAYEPIWAIGTGKNATLKDAEQMLHAIRRFFASTYSEEVAQQVRILYGGSVRPTNIRDLMQQKNVDGVLVGGASLRADSFSQLIRYQER